MIQKLTLIKALFAIAICISMYKVNAQTTRVKDTLRNLRELSLPLADQKLVIAHNMTDIIRFKGHDLEDSCDPEYYPPKGNITENLGGMVQVNVMADRYLKDSTLEQTVEMWY